MLKYFLMLSQKVAQQLDQRLFETFTVEQLVELAGQACALAISEEYSPRRVSVVVGSGNNGNDGIVCARYLKLFGYDVQLVIPKVKNQMLDSIKGFNIPIYNNLDVLHDSELLVDALLGFGASGPARAPYLDFISYFSSAAIPVVSIDIPSGWHPEDGDLYSTGFSPEMLISLTAPKLCAKFYTGIHYVGGRFISDAMAKEYHIDIQYPGNKLIKKMS